MFDPSKKTELKIEVIWINELTFTKIEDKSKGRNYCFEFFKAGKVFWTVSCNNF